MKWCKFAVFAVLFTVFSSNSQTPSETAQDEVKVDLQFLNSAIGNSRCFDDDWRMPFCLRALNDMMRFVSGHDVQLLHASQISRLWEVFSPENGTPYFKHGNLVVAKLSAKGIANLSAETLKNYSSNISYRRYMADRFKAMANGTLTPEDIQAAFDFVISRAKSEDQIKSLAALFYSAEVKESSGDPYAWVATPRVYSQTMEKKSVSIRWLDDRFLVNRIRPGSIQDQLGLYVGASVESAAGEVPTPKNINRLFALLKSGENKSVVYRGTRGERVEVEYTNPEQMSGVYHYSMNLWGRKIAVLEILSFHVKEICDQAREAILEINQSKAQGLIIDLRGNGGGSLSSLRCIAGLIFGKNLSMGWEVLLPETLAYKSVRREREDVVEYLTSEEKVLADGTAVSFLVNAQSASASELFSGFGKFAFQNVWVIGQRTYGKGIGQLTTSAIIRKKEVPELEVTSTFMRMHLPNGETFHLRGVQPDFVVETSLKVKQKDPYVERFGDIHGEAFYSPQSTNGMKQDPTRQANKALIAKCVQQLSKKSLPENTDLWRWLEDQQLRKAAMVSACQISREADN